MVFEIIVVGWLIVVIFLGLPALLPTKPKDPFGHLDESLRKMCDDFDAYSIESVIGMAENLVEKPVLLGTTDRPPSMTYSHDHNQSGTCINCSQITTRKTDNKYSCSTGCDFMHWRDSAEPDPVDNGRCIVCSQKTDQFVDNVRLCNDADCMQVYMETCAEKAIKEAVKNDPLIDYATYSLPNSDFYARWTRMSGIQFSRLTDSPGYAKMNKS